MDPNKEDPLSELSDEELGRLFRERYNQEQNIEGIANTNKKSQENWFRKQLKMNRFERFFDGLQQRAEKEIGIDDE